MGDVLCIENGGGGELEAEGVMGGALFLRNGAAGLAGGSRLGGGEGVGVLVGGGLVGEGGAWG